MEKHLHLDDKLHWYKEAVIYDLHIKAFRDANGDGVGDFEGLMQKLDYLQELGITAIWLLPFYPSPLRDDGYDIADYYNINPTYGNIKQFKELLEEAHKRDLKVITELVINHTSDQHPWFQRARTALKGSAERNYYVWTDDPHQYKDVRIIFQDFEASNWTWDPVAQQYYWHRFFHHQPDLNYDSEDVQKEVFKIIDYWCNMGVDGFRLDAVPYLYEREGTNGENLPETHAFLKRLRAHIDDHYPGTVLLAEANMWPEDSASYFGDGDECHMNYHFPVMPRMFMSLQMEDRYPITDIFDQTPAIPEVCQWAIFLRNHDELTLEMVTDEERDFMYKTYAKDPKAKINLGIRHRLAPLMDNNRRKIELMNSLLFSLRGTPVIYYGDEIGMGDNVYLGDRDGVRTPMQWSADRNAGFSEANPQRLYLPIILDPEYHYESVNVEMQRRNTSSLFWYMKQIINMRKKYKAFGRGDMKFIQADNPKILAFTRTYEEQTLLVIVNLSKFSQPAELNLTAFKGYIPVELFSKNPFPAIIENYFFTMAPHSFQWFVLEKAHYEADETEMLPILTIDEWDNLLSDDEVKEELENHILPLYMLKSKWYLGNVRSVHNISIVHSTFIPEIRVYNILVEVSYESGLPETYQIHLSFAKDELAKKLNDNCPQSIISQLETNDEAGILCDALYTLDMQKWLIENFADAQTTSEDEVFRFYSKNNVTQYLKNGGDIKPRMHAGDGFNTSIVYDNNFFLKIYRKVDASVNPDVELSRQLADEIKFKYIPAYYGKMEWQTSKGCITSAMLQELIENHGDGYSFMLERINNYIERILATDRSLFHPEEHVGSFTDPISFDSLPEEIRTLLGGSASEQVRLMGTRTGEMHIALADETSKDFRPEDFSLHYQRSLFSSFQSLVRETFGNISRIDDLPDLKEDLDNLLQKRNALLNRLKRIYDKKLDVLKIRIHGQYGLRHILFTGKDIALTDFGGNPYKSYSERRLKRSPLRDVTALIRSLYFVAYNGFLTTNHVQKEDIKSLLPFADYWAFNMGQFFMRAYLEAIKGSAFIPEDQSDFQVMFDTYFIERALADLNYALTENKKMVPVFLRMIEAALKTRSIEAVE